MNFWEIIGIIFVVGIVAWGCIAALCEAWENVEKEKTKRKELELKLMEKSHEE